MEPANDHERLIAQAVDEKFLEDPGDQSTVRDIATSVNFIIMSPSDSQFLVRYVQWRRDHPISPSNSN
jgi:RNase adaptor protein for sRNA GlmZ degradation